ncbi:carbohydrate ABC transporter permease [Lapillicoccus jejuensis]|uniref:Multiple sugar transport system permease protein n=1 Tax=Lapillicoccus jejuensis TaxID=402171 RepID=A0A542DVJ8_9MICO|nr:carbohydrate ABC transporter permease [Lapillicoccus jejuensis]TQJ07086.1 multiple sugar transport system permease protein [Lapillicoccus jejuensis]
MSQTTSRTTPYGDPQDAGPAATRAAAPPPDEAKRRVGKIVGYVLLTLFALVYLFPFVIQVGTSFKTDPDATNSPLNPIPSAFTTQAYQQLFQQDFGLWFTNSVIVAVVVTAGRVFFDSLAGYALARLRFRGRQAISLGIIATMAVPGVVLLIPKFLIIKQLGIYDTYAGMIVPLLADAAGVFIMKQFFETIPVSLEEAAKLDGAGIFRTFWSVVLPVARPALITITILSFQSSWNELPHFLVSRQSPDLNTLTTGVAGLLTGALGAGNRYPLKLAAAVLMTIPVAVLFFVFQKRIIGGSLEGAVKE